MKLARLLSLLAIHGSEAISLQVVREILETLYGAVDDGAQIGPAPRAK